MTYDRNKTDNYSVILTLIFLMLADLKCLFKSTNSNTMHTFFYLFDNTSYFFFLFFFKGKHEKENVRFLSE